MQKPVWFTVDGGTVAPNENKIIKVEMTDMPVKGSGNEPGNQGNGGPGGDSNSNSNGSNAKTGDTNDWMIFALLMIASLACCVIILRNGRKHHK